MNLCSVFTQVGARWQALPLPYQALIMVLASCMLVAKAGGPGVDPNWKDIAPDHYILGAFQTLLITTFVLHFKRSSLWAAALAVVITTTGRPLGLYAATVIGSVVGDIGSWANSLVAGGHVLSIATVLRFIVPRLP